MGLLLAGILLPCIGSARTILVGSSTELTPGGTQACDFSTIQAAVDNAKVLFDQLGVPNTIRVASNIDSIQPAVARETITIVNQQLTIEGGFADCAGNPDSAGHTVISGAGTSGRPVVRVTGFGVVELKKLQIVHGSNAGGLGGGIDFNGCGDLKLEH